MKQIHFVFALLLLLSGIETSTAQTLSYADAIGQLTTACGADLRQYCKGVELGGGRIKACLDANQAMMSGQCQQASARIYASIARRVAAQRNVAQICNLDILRFCAGVVPGDANILNCMLAVSPSDVGQECNQAISDTGWRTEKVQQ